ncbi:MAG: methyltransferase [Chloroflexi bacterium RBG_16_57_11]|nr:MAG: methyltransferase [Chloroflexi bacterium RBG_16_57_11]
MDEKHLSDTWERGDPYERYMGRWSRQTAPRFLTWLSVPEGWRWLDVGCGTGALTAAILDYCSPAAVTGVEPSQDFLFQAKNRLADRVEFYQGQAAAIPLDTSSVDVTVSGLILNFVRDQQAALAEMSRVTRNGGVLGAYVWDYAGKMELLRHFWDAAVELDPGSATIDEGVRFPVCNPDALTNLFERNGLQAVEVTAIDIPTNFSGFDDYWNPFLGGQGPAPAYVMALDETSRARLHDHIRQRVPVQEDGSIQLITRAWAVKATVVK